jgi:hypothetical protein
VLAQLPTIELTWLDGSGSTAECRLTINAQLPVAEIESAAIGLVAALSGITDAVLIRQDITYRFVQESAVYGADTSDKFRAGVFIFDCLGVGELGLIQIPSLRDELFVTNGHGAGVLIDTSDGDVVTFINLATDGNYSNPFASILGVMSAAYRQSRV